MSAGDQAFDLIILPVILDKWWSYQYKYTASRQRAVMFLSACLRWTCTLRQATVAGIFWSVRPIKIGLNSSLLKERPLLHTFVPHKPEEFKLRQILKTPSNHGKRGDLFINEGNTSWYLPRASMSLPCVSCAAQSPSVQCWSIDN